jgi:hypothetical protein
MELLYIGDKQKYLDKNYPFGPVPKLTDTAFCIHCQENFVVGNFKVEFIHGESYIVCPNFPRCDGTVIDWFPEQSDWYGVKKKPAQ